MTHYFESGFFVRQKAWHGLGTVLDDAPSTREALVHAGLDWHVNLQPVYARLDGDTIDCPDHRAMVRDVHQPDGSIRSDVLGIVGKRYAPLQNVDAFSWFDPLVADGDVSLEAAGSVKGGRHVWILARINDAPQQVGRERQDIVCPYLLLSNSHDGTRAITSSFTPIRVVCWNTLSAANAVADRSVAGLNGGNVDTARKVRHTRSAANTLASIRDTIDLARRNFSAKALVWREMSSVPLGSTMSETQRAVEQFARRVFSTDAVLKAHAKSGDPLPEVRAEKHLARLLRAGPGASSAGITPFGLYMAATHYVDHVAGHTNATRLASTWFGNAAGTRDRAEREAMALAGIA